MFSLLNTTDIPPFEYFIWYIKSEHRAAENYEKIHYTLYNLFMIIRFTCNGDYKSIWKNCSEANSVTFRPRACPSLGLNLIPLHVLSALRYHAKFEHIHSPSAGCRCGWWEWTCCKIMFCTYLHILPCIEWANKRFFLKNHFNI